MAAVRVFAFATLCVILLSALQAPMLVDARVTPRLSERILKALKGLRPNAPLHVTINYINGYGEVMCSAKISNCLFPGYKSTFMS